jgi:hypothetical protein
MKNEKLMKISLESCETASAPIGTVKVLNFAACATSAITACASSSIGEAGTSLWPRRRVPASSSLKDGNVKTATLGNLMTRLSCYAAATLATLVFCVALYAPAQDAVGNDLPKANDRTRAVFMVPSPGP